MKLLIVAILFWFSIPELLSAHQTGLSFLELREERTGKIAVNYRKPLEDLQAKAIIINYPAGCTRDGEENLTIENGFATQHYRLHCDRHLSGERVWIEGLIASDKGILFRFECDDYSQQDLLRATHPFVQIGGKPSILQLFFEYLSLGFAHILSGFDHLLFVLALIFLAPSISTLFWAVSSFTLAHSVTLAMGIFGILDLSPPFVEAMIAASIVVLYREVLTTRDKGLKSLPAVVFLFGLLHGLGFSGALSSIGLPRKEIPQVLLAFNIGIELGQLLFIFVVSILLWIIYRILPTKQHVIKHIIAYTAGSLASFWLIQRVVAF